MRWGWEGNFHSTAEAIPRDSVGGGGLVLPMGAPLREKGWRASPKDIITILTRLFMSLQIRCNRRHQPGTLVTSQKYPQDVSNHTICILWSRLCKIPSRRILLSFILKRYIKINKIIISYDFY